MSGDTSDRLARGFSVLAVVLLALGTFFTFGDAQPTAAWSLPVATTELTLSDLARIPTATDES